MRIGWFDKFLAGVAPGVAVRRLVERHNFEMLAGSGYGAYSGATDTRYRSNEAYNRSLPGTEDSQVGPYDRERLRLECRDLYRNNEITRGAVDRFPDYAVWLGLYPQAQTDNATWNQAAEDWWREVFVPTCDYRQRPGVNFVTFQNLSIKHRLLDGECGFILLKNGQLSPVEAERIHSPSDRPEAEGTSQIIEGVQTERGVVTGYWICPRDSNGNTDRTKAEFVRAENYVHCVRPNRIDQLRGIPDLAAAVNKLRDYDETDLAVLNKTKADARNLYNVESKGSGLPNERARGSYFLTDSDQNKERVEKQEFGQIWKGSTLKPIEGKTPTPNHVPYMEHELKVISTCVGIPYEYLMLIFTAGSFSAQRAAMLHANHTFRMWHDWVARWSQRVWNWRIAKAIKAGDLPPAPVWKRPDGLEISEWYWTEWSLPHFGWVDPLDQVRTSKEEYGLGLTSLKSLARQVGRERDDILDEKASDIAAAIARANAVNATNPGAGVTWRDFIDAGIGQRIAAPAPAGAAGAAGDSRPEPPEPEKDEE